MELGIMLVIVPVYFLLLLILGAFVGWLTVVGVGGRRKGFVVDAALGPIGYLLVAVAIAPNLREPLAGVVAGNFPLPAACMLPFLHQLYRRWRQGSD